MRTTISAGSGIYTTTEGARLVWAGLCVGLLATSVVACSSAKDPTVPSLLGEGDASAGAASAATGAGASSGPAVTRIGGTAGPGGPVRGGSACAASGAACTHPDECCSSFCVEGVCLEFASCLDVGRSCDRATSCCSGRCEPVTGVAGRQCLDVCLPPGARCSVSLDCCTPGCFDGVCGGTDGDRLCIVEGESCSEDGQCCSNICGPDGECEVDRVNRDCRPTGEDCTSGTGSGCCETCNESTDRCDFGDDTCRSQGSSCLRDSDCCRGQCLESATGDLECQTPCEPDGAECAQNADCCGFSCTGDPPRCGPPPASGPDAGAPPPPGCTPTRAECEADADCCTAFCLGGRCDVRCQPTGLACETNAACCSGLCSSQGTCEPPLI